MGESTSGLCRAAEVNFLARDRAHRDLGCCFSVEGDVGVVAAGDNGVVDDTSSVLVLVVLWVWLCASLNLAKDRAQRDCLLVTDEIVEPKESEDRWSYCESASASVSTLNGRDVDSLADSPDKDDCVFLFVSVSVNFANDRAHRAR